MIVCNAPNLRRRQYHHFYFDVSDMDVTVAGK